MGSILEKTVSGRDIEHTAPGPSQLSNWDDDVFRTLSLRGGDGTAGFDSDVKEDPSEDEIPPSRRRTADQRGSAAGRSNGGSGGDFQPGAIVRVKLKNFVTYEKAEFSLGPNLNMVIGPNGTGKSSLVCAICLGLGYPSSVLGRASAFGDFVKHGKEEAEIEIELQRKPRDRENYVVGLCIRREDNSRKFTINGSRATAKDIQKLMRSLRIQIDNLCQFLPQDKVAEFAGLTPIELLEKTLHAAAPAEMTAWQKELQENFVAQKEAQRHADQSSEQLRKMEARQQVLQADVDKLQERKQIQEEIERLEAMHLVLQYDEARGAYATAKKAKKSAEVNLKRLQDSSAPALRAVNRKQEYEAKVKDVVDQRRNALRAAEAKADEAAGMVDRAESKQQEITAKIEAERAGFSTKKKQLAQVRKRVTDLEAQYKSAPKEFDAADWNRQIREKEHLEREKEGEIATIAREADEIKTQGREKQHERNELSREIQGLDSQQGQLLNQLKRFNPAVAQGWEWLKENQDQFEKEIFGPAVLNCSVKDPRYSDLIQSVLQDGDLMCFTPQTKQDHIKLSAQFFDKLKISVSVRTCAKPLNSFQPPIPRSELPGLGFDGYVLDYLEGPEPVLAMLCSEKRIHASAVGLQELSESQYDRVVQGEKISQFACGQKVYRISRRREYGPSAVSTRITMIRKAHWWTDQPADVGEKDNLQRKHDALTAEVDEIKSRYNAIGQRLRNLDEEKRVFRDEAESLKKQKAELQKEYTKWLSLPDKIESERRNLTRKEEELATAKAEVMELARKLGAAILDKARAVLMHHREMAGIRSASHELLDAQVLLAEAKSDVAYLKDRNTEIVQRLEAEKAALETLKGEVEVLKERAQVFYEAASNLPVEMRNNLVEEANSRTAEDILSQMNVERAKLEVIQANNPQALEEYETWARRIEKEKADFAVQETRLASLTEKIAQLRSQWEPRLDELVGQINDAFSYNFEQISCAGEVGVHKDEDFDKWAIEIKVKFRENETLQRLDQHRQSGGERAVSTIFYLMSLQSMAQAPFRVVDEINQGMDPRNERMVHERMVEIACREHTSQYFLITPKLLSGLRYDERMRVHTIVSGEHVDVDGTEKMDFAKFAKLQRRAMGRR